MARALAIRILRGTKANLIALTGGNELAEGELAYTTDSKQVYIGGSTLGDLHLVGGVTIDILANRPAAVTANKGEVFISTDEFNKTYASTGSAWIATSVTDLSQMNGDLDDVADGITYGKVLNTSLSGETGHENKVISIHADTGAVDLSGDDIKGHIDDATLHRIINDAGTTTTVLWSADKIQSELDSLASGISNNLLAPVQDETAALAIDTTTGASLVLDKTLVLIEDLGLFRFDLQSTIAPITGSVIRPTDRAALDGRWVKMTDAVNVHNNLSSIQGGSVSERYHLTNAEHTTATSTATTSADGLLSAADKLKLDGLTAGGEPNVLETLSNVDGFIDIGANIGKNIIVNLNNIDAGTF